MTLNTLDDLEYTNYLRDLFRGARDARKGKQDTWNRNLRLIHNRLNTTGISSWQPQPRSSEIYPTCSNIVAWMMDNNIAIDCIPAADPFGSFYNFYSKLANDLSAVIYTNWITDNYPAQLKQCLWDSLIYSIGITKTIWDNELAGGLGNPFLSRIDPWSFYPDPYAKSLDDANFFVEVKRMTRDEIERRYPNSRLAETGANMDMYVDQKPEVGNTSTQMMMANPGQLPGSGTFGSFGGSTIGQFGLPHGQKDGTDADKTIFVYEYWLRTNEKWYDEQEEKHVSSRWKVVVLAKGEILMEEFADELWTHGKHPYDRIIFDDIGEFYGISLVDHLSYPQTYLNRLLSMVQQNAELCGNPIFLESSGGGTTRVPIINRAGNRLQVNGPGGMQNKPEWLRPPDLSAQVFDMIQFWIQRIENISGLSATTKGVTPNQRNAEGVINSIQEAAFVRIRSYLSNFESALESATRKIADLIIDNYDQRRIMAIIGPDGEKTAATLLANHWQMPSKDGETPLEYIVQIRAGSTTPTSRQARIAEADKLYALNAIDDQAVLEAHQYPHADDILERKYQKQQAGLIGGGGGGAARQRTQRSK